MSALGGMKRKPFVHSNVDLEDGKLVTFLCSCGHRLHVQPFTITKCDKCKLTVIVEMRATGYTPREETCGSEEATR